MDYIAEYKRWCEFATEDDLIDLLKAYTDEQVEDAFYRNLTFGTGGLRGTIGAGTNRMNIYTVGKATQGLSNYLLKRYGDKVSVVIGYDSRIKSEMFARFTASVFAANGISVYIWAELNPVSTVSFATRYLGTTAGVMITASHNPARYNGYKVYGSDGCQITTESAAEIFTEIECLDIFTDINKMNFDEGIQSGMIQFISNDVMTAFIEEVKKQSVLFGDKIDVNLNIVYSPLNGTGYIPVTRVLSEIGFNKITVVEEQRLPDGYFPTCPYPNPEIKETLELGLEYCRKVGADIMLATDPDCDRVGIAVKNGDDYALLSGNEVGLLLLDYICAQRSKHGKMPADPVMIKTIVTMDMGAQIASNYGVKTIDVLTGFKYIGEQIGYLEKEGKEENFIFGFEESYGYLSGGYVRDKDGVNAALLICEMFAYYKTRGISLIDKLNELFNKYGYCLNTLHSFEFEGSASMVKMEEIMHGFREKVGEGYIFAQKKIYKVLDYNRGLNGLPKSNVLKYLLEPNCSVVVRPSGTEPKLKIYISVSAESKKEAEELENKIARELSSFLQARP